MGPGRLCPALLLLLAAALAGCRVEPGACVPAAGHLCLTVHADAAAQGAAALYDIEVRRGAACAQLDQPPPDTASFVATCYDPVPDCRRYHVGGEVSALPRLGTDRSFTVDVDLSDAGDASAPADVVVALLTAGSDCQQAAALHLEVVQPTADLALAASCQGWHRPCRQPASGATLADTPLDHVACGDQGRLCCRDRCVDAPPPPVAGMSFVPAGELVLGDPSAAPGAFNEACRSADGVVRYRLGQPFYLDTTEASLSAFLGTCPACGTPTTDAMYMQRCVADRGDTSRAVNCVTAAQADQYCRARLPQGALPWEIEWEWAAGRGQSRYPWGVNGAEDAATCQRANGKLKPIGGGQLGDCASDSNAPVSPPGDASYADTTPAPPQAAWPSPPLLGMAGNVAEWVADHDATAGRGCPPAGGSPVVTSGTQQIIRGGSWDSADVYMKSTARRKILVDPPGQEKTSPLFHEIGVRCAWRFPLK